MNRPRSERSSIQLDPEFKTFLDSQKLSTRNTYAMYLRYWIDYTKMNGKESLEFRKADTDAQTEKKVLSFQQWLASLGKAPNTCRTACGAIRGFYASKRMPLVFIRSERKHLSESPLVQENYRFTKEDLAKMSEQGDLTEKYILICGASFGLRAIDFMALTFGDYRACHLDTDAPVSLGTRNTIKENIRANPFLSSDAVQVVKAILEKYPNAKDTDRVLDFNDEQILTLSLKRMFSNAHLIAGPRIVRFHSLRAYLIDRLSAICSESQWKQIVGKKIQEGAYVSTDQLREVYVRAMPSIVINGSKNHAKIEQLESALVEQQRELANKDTIIKTLQKELGCVTTETATNTTRTKGHDTEIAELKRQVKALMEKAEGKKDEQKEA